MEPVIVMSGAVSLAAKVAVALTVAQAVVLPDDPRLGPVRPQLEELVSRVTRAGLPADLVVSKVREGLAKGVAPERIEAAAARLTDSLQAAGKFVAERRPGAPPATELIRALAEAHLAGLALQEAEPDGSRRPATVRDRASDRGAHRSFPARLRDRSGGGAGQRRFLA